MVNNPLYDDANDGHYEHLPECKGLPPPSLSIQPPSPATTTTTPTTGQLYTEISPQLPPPRLNTDTTTEKPNAPNTQEKSLSHEKSESIYPLNSKSLTNISTYSFGEDCYTIMSPAGVLTIIPRTTDEKRASMISNSAKCSDDDDISV